MEVRQPSDRGKKINKKQLKKFAIQALAGFLYWTIVLTPYTIYVMETTWRQYGRWLLMQVILVPFLAPPSVWFINWFVKRFDKKS